MDRLSNLLQEQDGVVSRRQVLARGGDDPLIRRRVRRREWARVHSGVFLDHTGEPSWTQRLWAALLFYDRAVAVDASVLRLWGLRTGAREDLVCVGVDRSRRVAPLPGVQVRLMALRDEEVQEHLSPPRMRLELALLHVAAATDREPDAVAVLGDACQQRRTTPERLLAALERRSALRHRRVLAGVLGDVATGAYSALEQRYLTRVERPHGLPVAQRQRRVRPGRTVAYRDVEYLGLGTVVELDGRLGHETAADRWDDMDRDVDAARGLTTTLRLGWRHTDEPCRTAAAVAQVLTVHGWAGAPRPCSPGCALRGSPRAY